MVFSARGKAILFLELRVGFGIITARIDGGGLADITPSI